MRAVLTALLLLVVAVLLTSCALGEAIANMIYGPPEKLEGAQRVVQESFGLIYNLLTGNWAEVPSGLIYACLGGPPAVIYGGTKLHKRSRARLKAEVLAEAKADPELGNQHVQVAERTASTPEPATEEPAE